jgi:hypothetical protein
VVDRVDDKRVDPLDVTFGYEGTDNGLLVEEIPGSPVVEFGVDSGY